MLQMSMAQVPEAKFKRLFQNKSIFPILPWWFANTWMQKVTDKTTRIYYTSIASILQGVCYSSTNPLIIVIVTLHKSDSVQYGYLVPAIY